MTATVFRFSRPENPEAQAFACLELKKMGGKCFCLSWSTSGPQNLAKGRAEKGSVNQ
jgi:hypothetical protein